MAVNKEIHWRPYGVVGWWPVCDRRLSCWIFFLFAVCGLSLFISATAESVSLYDVPEKRWAAPYCWKWKNKTKWQPGFTDSGQVVFFEAATGKTIFDTSCCDTRG